MTINDIIQQIIEPVGVVGLIVVIGSLIKVTPLQINVWSWIARRFGNAINHDQMEAINDIKKRQNEIESKIDIHVAKDAEEKALEGRQIILQFGKEILKGEKHTREEFVEVLRVIDVYDAYCVEHPDFPNNRAVCAKKLILDNYQERLEKADFLAEEYRSQVTKEEVNR